MVFQDISPGPEIDNELILFRELFKIKSKYRNSLLISQGGRITQHLVEFLARQKNNIDYNIYNLDFKEFLDNCDFIPEPIKDFILIINDYRKNVVYSIKYEKELAGVLLSFLETFNEILKWFDKYCHIEFFRFRKVKQIELTREFLNKRIELEKRKQTEDIYNEVTGYYNSDDYLMDEFSNSNEIRRVLSYIPEILDRVKMIDDTVLDMNRTVHNVEYIGLDTNNTVHNVDDTVQNIDENVKHLLIEFKELNESINDIQKNYEKKLENQYSDEKFEKIMKEFSDRCVIKIRDSIGKKVIVTEDYKQEEKKLIKSIGEPAWNKLDDKSKTFLTTSKITYKNLNELNDVIDYSGVCLLVTKSLERELTKRFYKWFIDYLGDNYNNKEDYHTSLLSQNPQNGDYFIKPPKYWSLGGIPFILGFKKDNDPTIHKRNISRLIEFSKHELFRNASDEEIKEKLYEYGSNIDEITKKYRNRAAHVDEIKKVNAQECFDYVLDVEQVLKKMLDSFDK